MKDEGYKKLGARIRQKRQEKGWTQEMLATEIGMSLPFVGHIERGTRKPSLNTLVQIANAMSVSLDDLLIDSLTWLDKQNQQDAEKMALDNYTKLCEKLDILQETLSTWKQDAKAPEN